MKAVVRLGDIDLFVFYKSCGNDRVILIVTTMQGGLSFRVYHNDLDPATAWMDIGRGYSYEYYNLLPKYMCLSTYRIT
jgi:hypothetical protein